MDVTIYTQRAHTETHSVKDYAELVGIGMASDWSPDLPYWNSAKGNEIRRAIEDYVEREVEYQVRQAVKDGHWDAEDLPDELIRLDVGELLSVFLAQEYHIPRAMRLAIPVLEFWGRDDEADELRERLRDDLEADIMAEFAERQGY